MPKTKRKLAETSDFRALAMRLVHDEQDVWTERFADSDSGGHWVTIGPVLPFNVVNLKNAYHAFMEVVATQNIESESGRVLIELALDAEEI